MQKSGRTNWKRHNVRQLQVMTLSLLMLAGCAIPTPVTPSGTPTASASAACITLTPVHANRGKPGGPSNTDISAALTMDHPIERVRNLVGDTSQTLTQIDRNNAALAALCGDGHAQ